MHRQCNGDLSPCQEDDADGVLGRAKPRKPGLDPNVPKGKVRAGTPFLSGPSCLDLRGGRDRRTNDMSHRLHLFKSKIHRAIVTHADLEYEGSMTISGDLMDAANILEHEMIHVWNVTRGTRLTTYALRADEHSKIICMNGAAAHLAKPGDRVIIATFAEVPAEEAKDWEPTVVLVDDDNCIVDPALREIAGPQRRKTA